MYLHALTNKMVPDTESLSINELLKVATSQNNVQYCLKHIKILSLGSIDRSFIGKGHFAQNLYMSYVTLLFVS